jgi:hypothetical protein
MMEYQNDFPDGTAVEVYDTGRKRWYKGTILHVRRINEQNLADGWEVELRNGNRGGWDSEHIRRGTKGGAK